jgi:hypothetical protein
VVHIALLLYIHIYIHSYHSAPYHRDLCTSIAPPFMTPALDGGKLSASRHNRFTPRGKGPQYPMYRRLGGSQSRSRRYGGEKNLLPLPRIKSRPSSSWAVAIPTELPRVLTHIYKYIHTRLTSWKRILHEKLLIAQLLKKCPFMGPECSLQC